MSGERNESEKGPSRHPSKLGNQSSQSSTGISSPDPESPFPSTHLYILSPFTKAIFKAGERLVIDSLKEGAQSPSR